MALEGRRAQSDSSSRCVSADMAYMCAQEMQCVAVVDSAVLPAELQIWRGPSMLSGESLLLQEHELGRGAEKA